MIWVGIFTVCSTHGAPQEVTVNVFYIYTQYSRPLHGEKMFPGVILWFNIPNKSRYHNGWNWSSTWWGKSNNSGISLHPVANFDAPFSQDHCENPISLQETPTTDEEEVDEGGEEDRPDSEASKTDKKEPKLKNQFSFCERASQTLTNPLRVWKKIVSVFLKKEHLVSQISPCLF